MLSESSVLLNDYIKNSTIDSTFFYNITNTTTLAKAASPSQNIDLTTKPISSAAAAAAAAAYIYLEKVKNEHNSPHVTVAEFELVKDDVTATSAATDFDAAIANDSVLTYMDYNKKNYSKRKTTSHINDNLVNNRLQNHTIINSINNVGVGDEPKSVSMTKSCNQFQQQKHQLQNQSNCHLLQPQQQQLTLQMSNNHVKTERLSPDTNADFQISISRSRSTTPSSFRETSPQHSVHSSPSETLTQMHNLSTNLLSSFHPAGASSHQENSRASSPGITGSRSGLPRDFSKRNYSDFMRSLAAKYNNENPNETLKRNFVCEAALSSNTYFQRKTLTESQKTTHAPASFTPLSKEDNTTPSTSSLPPTEPLTSATILPARTDNKLSQQSKVAAVSASPATDCNSNTTYIAPFLSTIPGIFPSLIDMSSTQALITLARAAQENEIHSILNVSSKNPKKPVDSTSPSPSPSLNMALQQAAQFISPALIYSVRLQKQQQQHCQVATQSSPRLANTSNSFSKLSRNQGCKVNITPLDLTAQPPAIKRFKAESTSSQSSTDTLTPIAIARRASFSTVTTSPSPPPSNENTFNASSSNIAQERGSMPVLVDSGTNTEETTTSKFSSSTFAISTIAPAISRQCQAQSEELNSWTVNDVCSFVSSIDICAEYVKHFREQCIDGSGLPLLTEDHLVNSLGMKLGPALKLRSILAKKLGGPCPCVSCVSHAQQMYGLQTSGTVADSAVANDCLNSCNSHLQKSLFSDKSTLNCNSHTSDTLNTSLRNREMTEKIEATRHSEKAACKTSIVIKCCDIDGTTSNTMENNSKFVTVDGNTSLSAPHLSGKEGETTLQQQNIQKQQ